MTKGLGKAAATIASAAVISHVPVTAQEIPSETWMGIYLGKTKIGYTSFVIDKATFRGKPGYRLDSTSTMRVLALGEEVEQELLTRIYLNEDFEPLYEIFEMMSAGHATRITAKFEPEQIVADVFSEGTKSTETIPIPPGSKLVGDATFFPVTMKLKVGDKLKLKYFNPLSLSLDDVHSEVARTEDLELEGKTHKAFVIRNLTPYGEMTCWQDEKGNLLKVASIMRLVMLREPKEKAQRFPGVYLPPSDLAVVTSVPTDIEIPNARQVKFMKARLVGLGDKSLAISDRRQKVKYAGGESPSAEYEIKAFEVDASAAATLPIKEEKLKEYLQESPYVQPTNPEILALAREVVGDEDNAYKAAARLRTWVHENIQSRGNIGIVRSSVDVLHGKTGVCRDYAILYAALARSVGIPTKLVAGLVFWKGGFYYHAWAESYAGAWIPMDATLPTDFVDATHIKLAEGEATAMFDMVKTMGSLKVEIVEFK